MIADTNLQKEVEVVWKKFIDRIDNMEQDEFTLLSRYNMKLTPYYNNLRKNFSNKHAKIFINLMTEDVFPRLGIK